MDQTLDQIASRTVGAWLETRDGEMRAARASGQRAASSDMSLLRRRLDDFEDGLLGRAKASILTLQRELTAYGDDLNRQVDDLNRDLNDHIHQQMSELREEKQRALQAVEKSRGPSSAPFERARRRAETTERELRTIRADISGRPLRRSFVWCYLPIMFTLALVEIPVNRLAFELFFQEQPVFSLVLAAIIGAVLIFFADRIGTLLRRTEQERPNRGQQIKRILGILIFSLLAVIVMFLLAKMRQLFVNLLDSEQSSNLSAMVQQLTQGGAASTMANVAHQEMGTAGWTLLVFNVALFVFGITTAFLRHDPHPDYEHVWHANERAQRKLTRLKSRYERELHAQTVKFDTRMATLDQLTRETQVKIDDLARRHGSIEPFLEQTSRRIANSVRNRSLAFQEGAIAGIPKGAIQGSLEAIRSMTEEAIKQRISGHFAPG